MKIRITERQFNHINGALHRRGYELVFRNYPVTSVQLFGEAEDRHVLINGDSLPSKHYTVEIIADMSIENWVNFLSFLKDI
jgi:hypothetical protein